MNLNKVVDSIIATHRDKGWKMKFNNAYHMGGHNIGTDVVDAAMFVEQVIHGIELAGDLEQDCQSYYDKIMSNIGNYENSHHDPEGYGYGTVKQIALDVKALSLNQR